MSTRKHFRKSRAYEYGESNHCEWVPIAAALIGGGLGYLSSQQQANAIQEAAEQTAQSQEELGQPQVWAPAEPYAIGLLEDAQRIYEEGGFDPGVNELELLGRANMLGYAEDVLPDLIGATHESWLTGLDPGLDPYVQDMIQMAQGELINDYMRNILPAISDQAQATGGYGGSRQGVAQGVASDALLGELGDVATSLLSDAYGQSLQHQQAAWQVAPEMALLGFMPSQAQQDVGALYRTDPQAEAANLLGLQSVVLPYSTPMAGTSGVEYPVAQSPITGALQGAAAGYGLGKNIYDIWSDTSDTSDTKIP